MIGVEQSMDDFESEVVTLKNIGSITKTYFRKITFEMRMYNNNQ